MYSDTLYHVLTFSLLFDLLSSRNDFCSGLGGPRCGVSSRSAATRSSAALGIMPDFSFSLIEFRLLFTLFAGVGDPGFAPALDMPLGVEMWAVVMPPSCPLMPGADVGATFGPEPPFCFDDLNRNDMSAGSVWVSVYARLFPGGAETYAGDKSASQSAVIQSARLQSAKRV